MVPFKCRKFLEDEAQLKPPEKVALIVIPDILEILEILEILDVLDIPEFLNTN